MRVPIDQLESIFSSLLSKRMKHGKFESDLPTHVRSPQSCPTAQGSCRVRKVSTLVTCVGIASILGSLSWSYSVYSPEPVARNPAYLIKAKSGAVASENIICSDLGVGIMKEGGNAVDAAVATTFCIGVVNMFSWVLFFLPVRGGH